MRLSAVCAVVLPISAYAAAIVLPFQDSALDPVRRNHQCPRIQRRSEECDNEAKCCKPGYGCNTSGKGSVGQVCVKRENNYCADDSACGKDQACITNYVNGVLSSFCGFVEPNPFLIQVKRNNPPTPTPAPRPPRAKCMKTYTVKKGDTCAAIIKAVGGLTLADFYRLNPSVNNPSCNNLQIGDKVCVDPSMSMGASATPMLGPSATGTPMLMPSGTGTPMLMPSGTGTPMLMPSASMAPACAKRVPAKAGDTCVSLIANAGGDVTLPDFFRLNPQVNSPSCNNLQVGQMYCVAPTVTCAKRYTVKPGDTCAAIVARTPGLTLPAFFAQNPSVNNPSCNNLQPGLQYCVVPALAPSSMMMAPSSMMMAPSATPMMQKPMAAPTGAPKPARRRR